MDLNSLIEFKELVKEQIKNDDGFYSENDFGQLCLELEKPVKLTTISR